MARFTANADDEEEYDVEMMLIMVNKPYTFK